MLISWIRKILFLVLAFGAAPAPAFVDPPTLITTNAVAGVPVYIRLRYGECDNFFVFPAPRFTIQGDQAVWVSDSVHVDDLNFCIYQTFDGPIRIGTFSEPGDYTLVIRREYDDFFGVRITETLGTLNVRVGAANTVPTNSWFGLTSLVLLILFFGIKKWTPKRMLIGSAFFLISSTALADVKSVFLLLSHENAPDPQEIVDYVGTSPLPPGPPPLDTLAQFPPIDARYLLSSRASPHFRDYLLANPDLARAKMERYLVLTYPESVNLSQVLAAFDSEASIDTVHTELSFEFSAGDSVVAPNGLAPQYGRLQFKADQAWTMHGGHALIGLADSGTSPTHPGLALFQGSSFVGGPFLEAASWDVSLPLVTADSNVDEMEGIPIPQDPGCNPGGAPTVPPDFAGHGTHASGLIVVRSGWNSAVLGTCRDCSLSVRKIGYHRCDNAGDVSPVANGSQIPVAIQQLADHGAQVINLSFGSQNTPFSYCTNNPSVAYCLAMTDAIARGVVLVGASGNHRQQIQFPAADPRVVAAGGVAISRLIWDRSPGSTTNCPSIPPNPIGSECGSNFSQSAGEPRQELMAAADAVVSVIPVGVDWNVTLGCGDAFELPDGDGIGSCTGTSMSAPQVSGAFGILSSSNPLLRPGSPDVQVGIPLGMRTVMASTTDRAQNVSPWSQTLGFGIPDTEMAVRLSLGTVSGNVARNRVTPLFRMYSAGNSDYAEAGTPQMAVALAREYPTQYVPQGDLIAQYPAFPTEATTSPGQNPLPGAPRATTYILTGSRVPNGVTAGTVPVRLMAKANQCTTVSIDCLDDIVDFTLATTPSEIEALHNNAGYSVMSIQGYIYAPCSPEPSCIPPGAERLHRKCNTALSDCAVFLERERVGFESQGYTGTVAGLSTLLGYAYPSTDTDLDGLVDGYEFVAGTLPLIADSDSDGTADGIEYPMSGVPISDPCNNNGNLGCPGIPVLFANGFE